VDAVVATYFAAWNEPERERQQRGIVAALERIVDLVR
jgi:hypothetical protein